MRPVPHRRNALAAVILSAAVTLGACAPASLSGGPTVAQAAPGLPPVAGGAARVWFLRLYEPSETLRMPTIFIDGMPLAPSIPGTAFFRDVMPGGHTFAVETCTVDVNQSAALVLPPGSESYVEIQSLKSFTSWGCVVPETFYARPIAPERAQAYFRQLVYRRE